MTKPSWYEIHLKLPIRAIVTGNPVIDDLKCSIPATTLLGDKLTGVIYGTYGKKLSKYMPVGRKFLIREWEYAPSSTEENRVIHIKQIEFLA